MDSITCVSTCARQVVALQAMIVGPQVGTHLHQKVLHLAVQVCKGRRFERGHHVLVPGRRRVLPAGSGASPDRILSLALMLRRGMRPQGCMEVVMDFGSICQTQGVQMLSDAQGEGRLLLGFLHVAVLDPPLLLVLLVLKVHASSRLHVASDVEAGPHRVADRPGDTLGNEHGLRRVLVSPP